MDEIDYAQQYQANEIAAALSRRQKMQGESAKICAECEEPIPEKRRQASPGCRLCITCQRDLEGRR